MEENIPDPTYYNAPWKPESFNGMPYRYLGRSGLQASCVGLGTWKYGYPETGDGARVGLRSALEIFDRAVELGVTFWDTANRYNAASGNSERVIGEWLRRNPNQRRNIVLATKLFGGMDGFTPNHSGLSRTNILDSISASLERLHSDRIDLLYFHAFDPQTPVEESLLTVEDLVRQDLVRYFAVSNFNAEQIKRYLEVGNLISGRCRIVAVQNQFNILQGESETTPGILSLSLQAGFSFIAWSPLARGLLTSRYLDGVKAGPGDRLYDEQSLENDLTEENRRKQSELAAIAREYGIELSQLVLAYMLSLKGMGPVIPSSSTVKQLEINAHAGKINLNSKWVQRIESVLA